MQTEPRSTVLMGSPAVLPSLWPAFALCLSMAVANGLGRFAYALLLPAMREDLQWTYAQAGWLNTANALGYVLGAGTAYALLHRVSARRLFQAGLGLCVFTLAVTGASGALPWLSTQRVLNGVGAAWVSACGSTLVLLHYRHAPNRRGAATGLFFGGAGIGIIAAGLAVAPLLAIHGAATWPTAWLVLGAVGLLASIWPMTLAGRIQESTAVTEAHDPAPLPLRHLGACLAAYFCWAGGYIIYLTFIFAWLRDHGLSWQQGIAVWTALGIAILCSGMLWRRALGAWPGAHVLSACCAVSLLGTLAPLLGGTTGLFVSAAVFGSSVFIAAAAIAVLVRQNLPAARIGRAMALFNLAFAAGQAIGPVAAGAVADRTGLDGALWLSAALHVAAVALPWAARAPRGAG